MPIGGDFLVIGSGIAGLRAAISLAESGRVVILTKADPRESNTGYAQGGIAAAVGADDSPSLHARDTMAAAARLSSSDIAPPGPEHGTLMTVRAYTTAHALVNGKCRFAATQ